ncbi:helix-turn-helix domain-containing protein [Parasphingorhabdus litoris]|uniref:helix-turn-helix domain-containing protein n=1 Tax=Parasphingorhabdus litoris TaxID=394733 RepID=UPI001E5F4839|nr:helix-turn-helix domain-containing protein [Parasphingorhabdus litoris]
MKLTPSQFRNALGITQETLRHWRNMLPIFHGRLGYAPVFTPGDLVAGAVIKELRYTYGISIKKFAIPSASLGKVCNETPWNTLSNSTLLLTLADNSCKLVPSHQKSNLDSPCIAIPLSKIMDRLTKSLLLENGQPQHPFYFPLTAVEDQQRKFGRT